MDGKEWIELGTKSQRGREGIGGIRTGEGAQGPLTEEGGLYLDVSVGIPEFLVTPLLMGPVCIARTGLKSQFVRGSDT